MSFKNDRNKYNAKFGKDTEWSLNKGRTKSADTEFTHEHQQNRKPLKKDKDGNYYRGDVENDPEHRNVEFADDNFESDDNCSGGNCESCDNRNT